MTDGPLGVDLHPDLSKFFVHFTGRPVDPEAVPRAHANGTAESRLVSILTEQKIRAISTYGSPPVVCVCDVTRRAANVLLSTGVTWRGKYQPWGILLNRQRCVELGFRPALYLSDAELALLNTSHNARRLIEWRVVGYEPASNKDWTHEREWRIGFARGVTTGGVDLAGVAEGVIVGSVGWPGPPGPGRNGALGIALTRYAWTGTELVDDGVLRI